ncbi:hypothetical protein O3M35_003710 [Rhynocoris fuscipes]|uniref:receptor protein-tyrosine kinase n=1 Tax=Rhynocoris fuscipes TaxID=488301 RepID=A0AAW1CMQ9_9HEMI
MIISLLVLVLISPNQGVHIIPNEIEMTLPAGANLYLECFGFGSLEWNFPSDNSESEINITSNTLQGGHTKSTLIINNIYYLHTGYYSCQDESEFENARIYVYVRDIKHLLVFNESHSLLRELQDETFYIPCRPTFSEVNVTLWKDDEDKIDEFRFYPHHGFRVDKARLIDSGMYTCRAFMEEYPDEIQSIDFTIHISPRTDGIKKPKINFHGSSSGQPVIIGEDVVLECSVVVSLGVQIHFNWTFPFDKQIYENDIEIKNSAKDKKNINGLLVKHSKSVLTLRHVNKNFQGKYICTVMDNSKNSNQDEYLLQIYSENTTYLNLTAEGKLNVTVRGEGSTAMWLVKVSAHPSPKLIWLDPSGKKLPSDSKKYVITHGYNYSKVILKDARMRDSGFYTLQAENPSGIKTLRIYLAVEDIPQITISLEPFYLKNEDYLLKCIVLAEPSANVLLTFTPCKCTRKSCDQCNVSNRKHIPLYHSNSSMVSKEYFGKMRAEDNGKVTCTAINRYGTSSNVSEFRITDARAPVFSENAMKENENYMVVPIGALVKWKCQATGLPPPTIQWFKDGLLLKGNQSEVYIKDDNQTLIIPIRSKNDDGIYTCVASNKAGKIEMTFSLKLRTALAYWIWILIACIVIAGVAVILFLLKKVHHEKKLREKITAAGLYYFHDGQIESINPDLSIGEQADLLPYDKKWEIPREKIKLGIQLGSGAFGVVMKAEVSGLREGESSTIVAVKMAKKNSDISLIKALVSELKIMSHLGQHLNVVNLLGACTSGIYTGEVLVLVEYCKYGNLHNYLLKHRDAFINQVNPQTGNLDVTGRFGDRCPSPLIVSNNEIYGISSDYGGVHSVNTEMTTCYAAPSSVGEAETSQTLQSPVGEDGYLISRPFVEKARNQITTKDLICWSYQIARGMEYLASRKVLHGDLATRNILLAEGNIVKICDFGFAKSMYQDENYTKKGNDPLPLKWLSIEALRDRVFSTQSDIWAYGIVLWEIFSLAKTPYPGKQFDQQLFDSLLEGYRMDKPDYSTEDIYNLMLECWKEQPMLRPSFTECADRLGNMLEESVVQHYMELNDPYLRFNAQTGDEDYLNKINSPTYSNFCALVNCSSEAENQGTYVNMTKAKEQELEMKPMIEPEKAIT